MNMIPRGQSTFLICSDTHINFGQGVPSVGYVGELRHLSVSDGIYTTACCVWSLHINGILTKMEFKMLSAGHSVYVHWAGVNRVWLALYVDDIFLTRKVLAKIAELMRVLGLDTKVMESSRYLLGIELRRRQQF